MNKFTTFMIMALLYLLFGCSTTAPNKYDINDIRIFKTTNAWELAQAIEQNAFVEASQIISNAPELLACQESEYGFTLLHWAIYSKKLPQTQFLLEHGADPNIRCLEGIDATTYAAHIDNTSEFLRLCIQYNGDVNSYTTSDKPVIETTPLLAAIAVRNIENVKFLIERGADVNLRWYYDDIRFESPLTMAISSEDTNIVSYLLHTNQCALDQPVRVVPETLENVFIVEDLRYQLQFANTYKDSLRWSALIEIAEHKLDSLKRK